MIYIRIVETVYNLTCKLLQFLLRQRQGRDHFVINGLQHEVTDIVIMHGLSYDVVAAQVRSQYERGMRTVQDTNLSLLIRLLIVSEDNRKSCIGKREFLADVLSGFDNPQSKRLTGYHDVVFVTQLLPFFLLGSTGITGNDTVYQSRGEYTCLIYPLLELIAQSPQLDQLHYALLQHNTFVIDQLYGKHYQTLAHITLEGLESVI